MRDGDRRPEIGRPIKGAKDPSTRLPWWHRRVVVVSDDEAWASRILASLNDLDAEPEWLDHEEAATLEGPVGALIIHASSPDGCASELAGFASRGWQPISLVCLPAVRGAARLAHDLDRLGYSLRLDPELGLGGGEQGGWVEVLARILDRGGWIVPKFAAALGWLREPSLVNILALPILAAERRTTVKRWRRDSGSFSYAAFEALFRDNDAPSPKRVLDLLRLTGAAVWAARQSWQSDRRRLAKHLGYASSVYVSRRTKELTGLTATQLLTLPLANVVEATTEPLAHGVTPRS